MPNSLRAGTAMRRREFITFLGGAIAAWPLAARAQQRGLPVVGLLSSRSASDDVGDIPAFHQGLNDVGFVADRNVVIEYRWAESQYDRLPALAADLVRQPVTAIAAIGGVPS